MVGFAGFCWGGRQSFRFATNRPDLSAAFVFYGNGPESKEEVARIKCPVYGFYGGNDARINATIPPTAELMKAAGKKFEPVKNLRLPRRARKRVRRLGASGRSC